MYQLAEPATTWALVWEYGATPPISGTLVAMAVMSSSLRVVREPLPRLTPPLVMLPGRDDDEVGPQALDLLENCGLRAGPDGHGGDDRADADDDPEHGEK